MIQPVRIQRSRQHKQVSPNELPIKYVGRPGKWGNPFKVLGQPGNWFIMDDGEPMGVYNEKSEAIYDCISSYREVVHDDIKSGRLNLNELRGHNLSCWCKIGEPCHVDVLIELLKT